MISEKSLEEEKVTPATKRMKINNASAKEGALRQVLGKREKGTGLIISKYGKKEESQYLAPLNFSMGRM